MDLGAADAGATERVRSDVPHRGPVPGLRRSISTAFERVVYDEPHRGVPKDQTDAERFADKRIVSDAHHSGVCTRCTKLPGESIIASLVEAARLIAARISAVTRYSLSTPDASCDAPHRGGEIEYRDSLIVEPERVACDAPDAGLSDHRYDPF